MRKFGDAFLKILAVIAGIVITFYFMVLITAWL